MLLQILNCQTHSAIFFWLPVGTLQRNYTPSKVFRDKKGFWCIKITNQVISLLKEYTKDITNLMKEHSFLHLWLRVWPFMNILPHHSRICEYLSIRNPLLIWKNLAPWDLYILIATKPFIPISCQKNLPTLNCVLNFDLQKICPTLNCVSNFDLQIRSPKYWRSPIISPNFWRFSNFLEIFVKF